MGDDILATEIDKKKTSWFKSALSSHTAEKVEVEVEVEAEPITNQEEPEQLNIIPVQKWEPEPPMEDIQLIFNRENQDKTAIDVISSIESLLKDRQLVSLKNQALNEQVATANETIQRTKREMLKKDQLIQDKVKEIRELETNLTNTQMSYDQLLEDYKEFQLTSNLEFEKLSNQLETEKTKYEKLYEESSRMNAQNANTITELQERIRNLEIENAKSLEQYEKITNEKTELMKSINDFTEKMSFSFNFKNKDNL